MEVGRYTPPYLIREELQSDKLKERADLRVWGYKRKLGEGKEGELASIC